MIETAMSDAGNFILWGGWQEAWDASAAWWQHFRERLPKKHYAGAYTVGTVAGGIR